MKNSVQRLAAVAFLLSTAFGCQAYLSDDGTGTFPDMGPPPAKPEYAALDIVRMIFPGESSQDSSMTWRSTYDLDSSHRVLLAFSKLSDHLTDIRTDAGNLVRVQLTLVSGDASSLVAGVKLCPITRQWNLEADWSQAFPYPGGNWGQAGGDFDAAGCVTATDSADAPAPQPSASPAPQPSPVVMDTSSLYFDVTKWYLDYPKARGENYGFVVISDHAFTVIGDSAGSDFPKLLWAE